VTIFSNTNDHCSGSLHYAKSTLEKLENDVAIVGSTREFGVLHPFLEKQLDLILYNEGEENEGPSFILSRKSFNKHILFSLLVNDLIIISKYIGHPFLFL
jgi:hypothetical protein